MHTKEDSESRVTRRSDLTSAAGRLGKADSRLSLLRGRADVLVDSDSIHQDEVQSQGKEKPPAD